MCYIINGSTKQLVRVLLDSGAQLTLIRRNVVNRLGLAGKNCRIAIQTAGGGETPVTREKEIHIQLQSKHGNYVTPPIRAVTVQCCMEPIAKITLNPREIPHLKNFEFTEQYPQEKDGIIDIILDTNACLELSNGPVYKGGTLNSAKAIDTKLGLVLGGAYVTPKGADLDDNGAVLRSHPPRKRLRPQFPKVPQGIVSYTAPTAVSIPNFETFWNLETLGILDATESSLSAEDERANKMMDELTSYDPRKKRFFTGLLWKADPVKSLDSNYNTARRVAEAAKSRSLRSNTELKINEAFNSQIDAGYAELIPKPEMKPQHPTYYIPTLPVYKPTSLTTKVRIVMNASSKCRSTGMSLNDCLYQGPTLLPDLVKLLLQFRCHKYVVVTDLSRMFWQLFLDKTSDMDCLRFLWQEKANAEFSHYRAKTLTFGVISSPFQAMWAVHKLCDMFEKEFPIAAQMIKKTLYMDDTSLWSNSIEEGAALAKDAEEIFLRASMQPHKWNTNEPRILSAAGIATEHHAGSEVHKVLGVQWNVSDDTIQFNFDNVVTENRVETKRTLIQQAASIFDPLGLISPFTLKAKMLFQQCWKEGLDWDKPLTAGIAKEWAQWQNEVLQLPHLVQPRLIACAASLADEQVQLAVFTDASALAYGACVYLIFKGESKLLFSKTRVAPVKQTKSDQPQLTIARLELLAAMIGTRVAEYVVKCLEDYSLSKVLYFTDSMITLWRIRNGPAKYKTWVANRVAEITFRSKADQWHFVPGQLNPADLASRGAGATELKQNTLWWSGPAFLTRPQANWPAEIALSRNQAFDQNEIDRIEQTVAAEKKVTAATVAAAAVKARSHLSMAQLEQKTSSWGKLTRVTAYVFRFLCRKCPRLALLPLLAASSARGVIRCEELKAAQLYWVRVAQRATYADQIKTPTHGEQWLVKNDCPIKAMGSFFDEQGLLRVTTRLQLSETLPSCTTSPILLPRGNPIVDKYVLYLHMLNGHSPPTSTLYYINRQFHLPGAKKEIRRILFKCEHKGCRRPTLINQSIAPLPTDRTDTYVPWDKVAVDLFGPLFCRHTDCEEDEKAEFKTWGCIFTCFATRAVHLELVEDCSTRAFLLAFSRMTSRRGVPSMIWSDNATNFKAANREQQRIHRSVNWSAVQEQAASKGIEWKFGIQLAPHTNGVIERMVRSVKQALHSSLAATSKLTCRHLETILLEAEAIVNDRPLAVPGDSLADAVTITPAQLCIGRQLRALPFDRSPVNNDVPFTRMQLHRRELINKFWGKWKRDYLLAQQATKFCTKSVACPLKEGQVVLLRDDKIMARKWKLARVESLRSGADGRVRRVSLRTPNGGVIDRHINQLSLLECDINR